MPFDKILQLNLTQHIEKNLLLNVSPAFASIPVMTMVLLPGLRFLVRLCTDMGLKDVQEYATKLKRVEKLKEIREQVCGFL